MRCLIADAEHVLKLFFLWRFYDLLLSVSLSSKFEERCSIKQIFAKKCEKKFSLSFFLIFSMMRVKLFQG